MIGLVSALSLFVALHSVPAMPEVKSRIVYVTGRPIYLAVYSLVSTAALVWLFYEALNMDYVELWSSTLWEVRVAFVTAPLGLFLVITGLLSPNPFSVTLRRAGDHAGAIVGVTRHPVLWGFLLWSSGHLFPNGDLRSVVLFGGFSVFSAIGIVVAERRARVSLGGTWGSMARATSAFPFLAFLTARSTPKVDGPLLIGAAVSIILTICLLHGGHELLLGADPIATLRSMQ
jgi:uncharacterized membrane protein